jgi:DNA-binding NarL/FixJ family response regulator
VSGIAQENTLTWDQDEPSVERPSARILIADSNGILRSGLNSLLKRKTDLEIVEAADLDDVNEVLDGKCPDIAVIDLDLPPLGGPVAVARIMKRCSAVTLVWGFRVQPEAVAAALRAGASGYLGKEITPSEFVAAVQRLAGHATVKSSGDESGVAELRAGGRARRRNRVAPQTGTSA